MSAVAKVVCQAGIIETDVVSELGRWGCPVPSMSILGAPTELADTGDMYAVSGEIEKAIQDRSFVSIKETDLEIMQQYLMTQQEGVMYVETLEGGIASWGVTFGRTLFNEYIIPLFERDGEPNPVLDILADCVVTLKCGSEVIALGAPRELHYGNFKMFTVWVRT